MVIVNWLLKISQRGKLTLVIILFQTAYYISKLILPRIVRNLHFWKILFSSMYLDESETP